MRTFAAIIVLPIISFLSYVIKNGKRWKPWMALWILWLIMIPVSFELLNEYVNFYRTGFGKCIFLITFIIFAFLTAVNIKKNSKTISIMTQVIRSFNYPLVLLDCWIVTFSMLMKAVRFFKGK